MFLGLVVTTSAIGIWMSVIVKRPSASCHTRLGPSVAHANLPEWEVRLLGNATSWSFPFFSLATQHTWHVLHYLYNRKIALDFS